MSIPIGAPVLREACKALCLLGVKIKVLEPLSPLKLKPLTFVKGFLFYSYLYTQGIHNLKVDQTFFQFLEFLASNSSCIF